MLNNCKTLECEKEYALEAESVEESEDSSQNHPIFKVSQNIV